MNNATEELDALRAERDALGVELEIAAEEMEIASMAIITDATTLTLADRQIGLSLARSAERARAALAATPAPPTTAPLAAAEQSEEGYECIECDYFTPTFATLEWREQMGDFICPSCGAAHWRSALRWRAARGEASDERD